MGLLRRLRRGVSATGPRCSCCASRCWPSALQSYGGEIGLRIYMFALPGACILAAYAFFPNLPAAAADAREETVPIRAAQRALQPAS